MKKLLLLLIFFTLQNTCYATDYDSNPTMAGTTFSHTETEHENDHDVRDQGASYIAHIYYKLNIVGDYYWYKVNLWNGSTWVMDSNWRQSLIDGTPNSHTSGGGTNETVYVSCTDAQRDSFWSTTKKYIVDATVRNYVPLAGTFQIYIYNDEGDYVNSGLQTITTAIQDQEFSFYVQNDDFQEDITIMLYMDTALVDTKFVGSSWENLDTYEYSIARGVEDYEGIIYQDPPAEPPPDPDPPEYYPGSWLPPDITIIVPPSDDYSPPEESDNDISQEAGASSAESGASLTGSGDQYESTLHALNDVGMMYEAGVLNDLYYDGTISFDGLETELGELTDEQDELLTNYAGSFNNAVEKIQNIQHLDLTASFSYKYEYSANLPYFGTVDIDLKPFMTTITTFRRLIFIFFVIGYWFAMIKVIRSAIA